MRAAALLGVFLVAKAAILAPARAGWPALVPVWQDVAAALVFGVLDPILARVRLAWVAYAVVVAWTALNVPVARVLSSPLTCTMLRAAGPELGDSIRYYLKPEQLIAPVLVVAAGALLPFAPLGPRRPPGHAVVGAALLVLTAGPAAERSADSGAMGRNACFALTVSALPRVAPRPGAEAWRSSPFRPAEQGTVESLRRAAAGRNLILVALESTGARYLGLHGASPDPMPNLTALARSALVVENAYAVYPESIKGLLSLLCSQYPAFDTDAEVYGRLRVPSLAEVLARAGYRTSLFHSGRFMYLGMEAIVANRGFDVLEDAGAIGGQRDSSFGIDETSTVRRILAWIDSAPSARRFFVTYLPIAGHHPYATSQPGPFSGDREIDRYFNALAEADGALARLRAGLEARGLAESTVWAIAGDHGEAFGQHDGNFGHTLFIHEENVRVPFVVALPGVLDRTVRLPATASLIDVGPTVLDLLGLEIPAEYQGRSLLAGDPGMALFYTDYALGRLGLRDGCLKYVYELEARRSRLYDLCRDADERRDLSGDYSDRIEFYRRRLERWSAAQKARAVDLGRGR